MSRQFSKSVYRGLKTATRKLLESFGPIKCAAGVSRIESGSTLARFHSQSPADEDRFMPVDVALDLMAASGDRAVLDYMADQLGYLVTPAPAPADCAMSASALQLAELGQTIQKIARTIEDGEVTAAEVRERKLLETLSSVIDGAACLRTTYLQIVEGGES